MEKIFWRIRKRRRKIFGEGKYLLAEEKKTDKENVGKYFEKETAVRSKERRNIWEKHIL